MSKNIRLLFLSIFFIFSFPCFSQEFKGTIARLVIVDGDTIPMLTLSEVAIYGRISFKTMRDAERFGKLVHHVKKVYPFAKLAGIKFKEYEALLVKVKSKKEKKELMKKAEKELKAQYGNDLKKLTFTQGKILIKLVDRETGNSSYAIVDEFRGWFSAFFWQSLARVFGYNLKTQYDPQGEDRDIETIVKMIENGTL